MEMTVGGEKRSAYCVSDKPVSDGVDLGEHLVNSHGISEPDPATDWTRLHKSEHRSECLDAHRSPCEGPVEYRWPGHGARSFPRCVKHQDERLDQAEADRQAYPDSPIAPDWFDPSAAGETWDEPE